MEIWQIDWIGTNSESINIQSNQEVDRMQIVEIRGTNVQWKFIGLTIVQRLV